MYPKCTKHTQPRTEVAIDCVRALRSDVRHCLCRLAEVEVSLVVVASGA